MRIVGDDVQTVCNDPVCKVNGISHRSLDNEDSGWYFYRVPSNHSFLDFYINMTILGEIYTRQNLYTV